MNNYCIITTINKPTKAVEKLYEHFGSNLIIVGDKKTPDCVYDCGNYIPGTLSEPYAKDNHYSRKNLGYMMAIQRGADLIYDTDDDNIPNENWMVRETNIEAVESVNEGWYNVYDVFSSGIWPRGFSIENLHNLTEASIIKRLGTSSIQQGLSDGAPDVDAIWRLVFNKRHFFTPDKSVYLNPNTWCPFNSQSTWWFPKAYPLMYLPVYASFRMTDIWRSFVAQRCLWELGEGVTFHSPSEVFQERNEHDLMKDFADEVPGYLNNDHIVEVLSQLELHKGEDYVCENLENCYRELIFQGILPKEELKSVKAWIKDYENITADIRQTQEGRLAR